MEQTRHRRFLLGAHLGAVVGVVEAQHLHHVFQRPFRQATIIGANLGLQRQGARAGPLDRATDPQTRARGAVQRVAAQPVVAQYAIARAVVGHLQRCIKAQVLERADAGGRQAQLLGNRFQLHPVVEGKDAHGGPVAVAVGGPVDLLQFGIFAQGGGFHAALEEKLQLLPRRIGRGAAVAADGEGAAGIGVFQRGGPRLAIQPALDEAGHEAVARA
ncbi:hypothetical protein GALL_462980 [mine drainage metagenome]|uniref:Uncharacterized protein n=1 Tax=mine drainage metagenome TaxID=410659 RepID=A0A1J5PMQ5_9ZZZZ